MRYYIMTLLILIFSAFSVINGQNIKPIDLHGEWTLDWGKNILYLNFINDSVYKFSSAFDTSQRIDSYALLIDKEEIVLELNMYSGTYIWSRKTYLIRKIDTGSYKLQIPESNQLGEILSYKWQKVNKINTFGLYRLE